MALHSNISPSAAHRWMACPGSVALCDKLPTPPTSIHAAEGTAAHSLCEVLVSGQKTPKEIEGLIGTEIEVENFNIEVTEEMVESAIGYYEVIEADRQEMMSGNNGRRSPVTVKAEERVILKEIDDHVYGTCDTILYRKGDRLKVYDFKYGKGVVVEAEKNPQLMIYALGAMENYAGYALDEVELVIVQPRAPHAEGRVRRWKTTVHELRAFAVALKEAVLATREKNAKLSAGSHCRWCPAKTDCSAVYESMQRAVEMDFTDATVPQVVTSLLPVDAMTPKKMAFLLGWEDAIHSWFDSIRAKAVGMLEQGQDFPGFKLVQGKSNRKWTDEEEVVKVFGPILGVTALFERKLLSPAKLEKKIGKGKVDSLTCRLPGARTLAPLSDPRPAINPSACSDFTAITQTKKDPLDGLI